MYKAIDVANYMIYLTSSCFDDVSNMKLNKLLYFAQGHYLQKNDTVLFEEPLEAWKRGPIVNTVYQMYKKYEDSSIKVYDADKLKIISECDRDFLLEIARVYGRYNAVELSNMTHISKGPWHNSYKKDKLHVIIPNELIKEYFVSNINELNKPEINFSEKDYFNRSDENGTLVLPKEWDDETI